MEDPAHLGALAGQFVVLLHGPLGLQDFDVDASLLRKVHGGGGNLREETTAQIHNATPQKSDTFFYLLILFYYLNLLFMLFDTHTDTDAAFCRTLRQFQLNFCTFPKS